VLVFRASHVLKGRINGMAIDDEDED
jgi:hypothetical protein